jgi:hypothetical protein
MVQKEHKLSDMSTGFNLLGVIKIHDIASIPGNERIVDDIKVES